MTTRIKWASPLFITSFFPPSPIASFICLTVLSSFLLLHLLNLCPIKPWLISESFPCERPWEWVCQAEHKGTSLVLTLNMLFMPLLCCSGQPWTSLLIKNRLKGDGTSYQSSPVCPNDESGDESKRKWSSVLERLLKKERCSRILRRKIHFSHTGCFYLSPSINPSIYFPLKVQLKKPLIHPSILWLHGYRESRSASMCVLKVLYSGPSQHIKSFLRRYPFFPYTFRGSQKNCKRLDFVVNAHESNTTTYFPGEIPHTNIPQPEWITRSSEGETCENSWENKSVVAKLSEWASRWQMQSTES